MIYQRQSVLKALDVKLRQYLWVDEERADPISEEIGADIVPRPETVPDGTQNKGVGKQCRPSPPQDAGFEGVRNKEGYPGKETDHVT